MAKATQTKTTTSKKTTVTVKAKSSSNGDMMKCNVCGGTGWQKKPANKKKK